MQTQKAQQQKSAQVVDFLNEQLKAENSPLAIHDNKAKTATAGQ
jgi:hypothetical protein